MQIVVTDLSSQGRLTPDDLGRMCGAVEKQLATDYASMWQSSPVTVRYGTPSATDTVFSFFDHADQAGALGYHSVGPDGRPYMKGFLEEVFTNGGDALGSTGCGTLLSHECIEALTNPYATFWADLADAVKEEALEPCDRVEADAYVVDGVYVSNFLGPRAFSAGGPGPYDFMGLLTAYDQIRPGGYRIIRNPTGQVSQEFGDHYPAWKKDRHLHAASRYMKLVRAMAKRAAGT